MDLDEVWEAVTGDIPELLQAVNRLITEIEAERAQQGDVEQTE